MCHAVPEFGIGLVQGKLLHEEETEIRETRKHDKALAPLSNTERINRLKEFNNLDFNIIRMNKREFTNLREQRKVTPFCSCKPLSRMTVCELRKFSVERKVHVRGCKKAELLRSLQKQGFNIFACCQAPCPCVTNGVSCMHQANAHCGCFKYKANCKNDEKFVWDVTPNVCEANLKWNCENKL